MLIDVFTERILALVDRLYAKDQDDFYRRVAKHCQFDDCYELAKVSDIVTSNHYCIPHFLSVLTEVDG